MCKWRALQWLATRLTLALTLVLSTSATLSRADITGTVTAHDPSTVVKDGNTFYYYCTGGTSGLRTRSSTNLSAWSGGPTVFATPPSWVTTDVPNYGGNLWAPDIEYFSRLYHLYYAASSFGSQVSGIGMATSPTLNPSSPSFGWTDHGPVIQSTNGSAYNAIDPSVFSDNNGSLWMTFGSFWQGIYLTQLDPATGLRLNPSLAPTRIARKDTGTDAIEASYLYKRGNFYYLFVNWNYCCQGVNSTYEVRVGRSTNIAGPFLDRNGVSLASGGGTQFLDDAGAILSDGDIIGPGQIGIFNNAGADYYSFHYYDGGANGTAKFDIEPLYWTNDAWPLSVVPEPGTLLLAATGSLCLIALLRIKSGRQISH